MSKMYKFNKQAINKGIIRYQRTLLIGNTLDIEKASTLQVVYNSKKGSIK